MHQFESADPVVFIHKKKNNLQKTKAGNSKFKIWPFLTSKKSLGP